MRVKDLKRELNKYNDDTLIVVSSGDWYYPVSDTSSGFYCPIDQQSGEVMDLDILAETDDDIRGELALILGTHA